MKSRYLLEGLNIELIVKCYTRHSGEPPLYSLGLLFNLATVDCLTLVLQTIETCRGTQHPTSTVAFERVSLYPFWAIFPLNLEVDVMALQRWLRRADMGKIRSSEVCQPDKPLCTETWPVYRICSALDAHPSLGSPILMIESFDSTASRGIDAHNQCFQFWRRGELLMGAR
jgi:hypothetical protein